MCDLLNEKSSQHDYRRFANFFFALAVIFGLLLIFLEPPFVCPDENAHFVNICRISRGGLFADVQDGKVGSWISVEEFDFLARYGGKYNGQGTDVRFDYHTAWELMSRLPSDEMMFFDSHHAAINPTPYLLASFVVAVMRFFLGGVNAYEILLISKIANLFFYAVVIRWALLKTGAFRHTMFLLALMPMAIFQGASTSYDAILIAVSFLLFAYATKILCADGEYRIVWEDVVAICLSCGILIGCKIAYAPLILILLSICVKKFGGWKSWGICVGAVVGAGVLFYLIPALVTAQVTSGVETVLSEEQIAQKAFFRTNFWRFPFVIFRTVDHFGGYWLESFIGILGWLDTRFPRPFLFLFFVISTLNAMIDACSVKGIQWKTRVFSLAGVLIFFVGTLYTMYVEWNPVLVGIVGGNIAYGGQGRYFIPVALFVLVAMSNSLLDRVRCKERIKEIRQSTVFLTAIVSLCLTTMLILVRYWA